MVPVFSNQEAEDISKMRRGWRLTKKE
jgi:hypothetical protein